MDYEKLSDKDLLWEHRISANGYDGMTWEFPSAIVSEILKRGLKVPAFCIHCGEGMKGKTMHPESHKLCNDCWEK